MCFIHPRKMAKKVNFSFSKSYGQRIWTTGVGKNTKQIESNLNTTDDVANLRSYDFDKNL